MNERQAPLSPGESPPKYASMLLGFAALAFLAGLIVLILSLGGRMGVGSINTQQDDPTPYPPTWTPYPETYQSETPSPSPTNTPYPGVEGEATLTPSPSLTLTATSSPSPGVDEAQPYPPSGTQDVFFPPTLAPTPPVFTSVPTPTFASLARSSWCVPWNTESRRALVNNVLDGVTIEVELDGETVQVRYIGVMLPAVAPEPGFIPATDMPLPPALANALQANRRMVEGKWVTLVKERSDVNLQGQLVRYVLADGLFVNHALVRQGYVLAHSYPPDQHCDVFLTEAERLAQATGLGYWSQLTFSTRTPVPTATPQVTSGNLRVVFIDPTGVGWADPNEFVEIRNDSTFPLQLAGWTLRDLKGHVFRFPEMLLNAGGYCRIYTNEIHAETCGLSFESMSAIWDDDGDCASLHDPAGVLIHQLCY